MKVFIVIVLYNKAIADLMVLKTTIAENNSVLIYDNSPNPQSAPNIDGVKIIYQHDASNSGVSRAYNEAALKAKELGCDVLLLLDQDTNFNLDYLSIYEAALLKYGFSYLYAPVVCNSTKTKVYSPAFINHFVGKAQAFESFVFSEEYNLNGKSVINSGLMIPLLMFEKIGGFNEKLKLDFSDYYFIEKFKVLNKKIILVDVYLKHRISGDEGNNFTQEYNRFRYFCYGARELGNSLGIFLLWAPFRRLIRLILKYKNLKFIQIYCSHFLQGNRV
jgi:GT2 family glycosyltransferase